ncbi:MAG: type VI secretion system contractile sheath large subunit, partial [Polyangiaceae bacterium]
VVYRSYQHTYESHADAERELNDWIGQYVSASGPAGATFLGQRPLRRARVRIREAESWAEWRQLDFKLRPHFKHRGAFYTLTCENRLETTKPGVR